MSNRQFPECIPALLKAGIELDDALALRKISMTLHRWHELECGVSNDWNSFMLVRGKRTKDGFNYEESGEPYIETVPHGRGQRWYNPIADREAGAKRRLARIMAKYPNLTAYIQGDPRGAALYILKTADIPQGTSIDSCYNRGIAIYK